MTDEVGSLNRAALAELAVEAFPNGAVIVFDKDLRYLMADGAALENIGLDKEFLEGKTIWEAFPPETAAALEGPYRTAVEQGGGTTFKVPYRDRFYEVHVEPIRQHDAIVGGIAVTRDITRLEQIERSLGEAEERFRSAFENAPIGIALVGLDGSWLRINGRISELLGYAEDELVTKSFQDITHPEDLDADLEFVRQMLAGEIRTYQMEKRYIRKDGTTVWAVLSVSLVRGDDDEPRYFVSQIVDISERRRYEEQLATHASELERANASLRAMDDLKGEFIAIASHELKTPLTSVRGSIATLRAHWNRLTEPERLELLDIANWQAERLHQLTDELLTLSRIESGLLEVQRSRVAVAEVVAEVVEFVAPEAGFEIDCPADIAISVDPTHLRQMLTNYITNAVKYGRAPFAISVSREGDDVEIRVRDHGPGVGSNFADRLFDKFTRYDARIDVPGTGLGLSIVRGLANANGGSAWYDGSERGAAFGLRFPAAT